MKKVWPVLFLVCGALLLGCALLVPAHWRAVDAAALEGAGKGSPGASTPTLIEEGLTFLSVEKLGPARMLLRTAQSEGVPRAEVLAAAVTQFTKENPAQVALGGDEPVLSKIDLAPGAQAEPRPIVELLARRVAREKALQMLQQSRRPAVLQILKNRNLTQTVHFPAAQTSSGQALEAAIITAGLLFQGDYFTPSFREALEWLAVSANRGENSGALELVYLDLLSVGKRLDWVSLTEFVKQVDSIATLRDLAEAVRAHEDAVPNIFAAVALSGNGKGVAKYLATFSETGMNDVNFALRHGRGAVELLIKQQQRIYSAGAFRGRVVQYDPFGAFFYGLMPTAVSSHVGALFLKYALLMFAALFIARTIGYIVPPVGHRFGIRFGADMVLASAIAFIVALSVEPFVGLPTQITELPFRIQIPGIGDAAASNLQTINQPFMKQLSLVSLSVFFVIQALIYVWCLTKIAQIRREPGSPRTKLRLLENEDHLFDAGLYIGFAGTVISLILVALNILGKGSTMMAYSSTSFGIIFVSVLKIFHIRPLRRKLILESVESEEQAQP